MRSWRAESLPGSSSSAIDWTLTETPYLGQNGRMPSPALLYQLYRDEFDGAYKEGTMFVLTLHPFIERTSGTDEAPVRIRGLHEVETRRLVCDGGRHCEIRERTSGKAGRSAAYGVRSSQSTHSTGRLAR